MNPALQRFDEALKALWSADPFRRPQIVSELLSHVPRLLREGHVKELYPRAVSFETGGGFAGTPWDRPARLRSRLWAGSFGADPPYPAWETMNTLRVLAIARGDHAHEDLDHDQARRFLERVLALNMDKLLEGGSEEMRMRRLPHHQEAQALLQYVFQHLPLEHLLADVADEVDAIMAQRPVWTHHVRMTLKMVGAAPGADEVEAPGLDRYVSAVLGPTPMSMRFRDPKDYINALRAAPEALADEAKGLGASLRDTGLACTQHGAFLHHLVQAGIFDEQPDLLADALGLDDRGRTVLDQHQDLVRRLVKTCIRPATAQTAYGLARLIERGLPERTEVAEGLERAASMRVRPELEEVLKRSVEADTDMTGRQILLGGVIRVLGQPLGIGQGNNPTCQAARGLSLWAQHRPDHLLAVLGQAAEEGDVVLQFEGFDLHSALLAGGLAPHLDPDLDPVSLALVPHLDRLYDELMRRSAGRGDDPHRWANPALYGRLVPPGFRSCFDATYRVPDHKGFLAAYYATFHPDHHAGRPPIYATPVGITVTDDRGRLLGLHAVLLQRVDEVDGETRVYFYNPNNEGRQDWGHGIRPTVRGHGEEEGESSLPFDQFAARVYAFHHPEPLPGDPDKVPGELLEPVVDAARTTWGRSYPWGASLLAQVPPQAA